MALNMLLYSSLSIWLLHLNKRLLIAVTSSLCILPFIITRVVRETCIFDVSIFVDFGYDSYFVFSSNLHANKIKFKAFNDCLWISNII